MFFQKRTCSNDNIGEWCSTGSSATIQLTNTRGIMGSTVGKYSMKMNVIAKCSEEIYVEKADGTKFGFDYIWPNQYEIINKNVSNFLD